QLDKTQIDTSVKSDGLIPAIKGYTPPAGVGPVYQAGYQLYQQALAKNAVVHAFRWETADDGLLPGLTDKVDAAAQDLITGRKTPAEPCQSLDTEWSKASCPAAAPGGAAAARCCRGCGTSPRSARPACWCTCASCWPRSRSASATA